MEVYESQQNEICRMAKKQGVAETDLAGLIEKQTKDIKFMFPDQSRHWILWRVEREVWNRITRDKFPGRMPMSDNLPPNNENRRPSTSKSDVADHPWIHDMFNPSPGPPRAREAAPPRSGKTDSYRPPSSPISSRSREIDSYKPATSSVSRSKDIDSYRPASSTSDTAVTRTSTSRRFRRPSSVSLSSLHSAPQTTISPNPKISSSSVTISRTPVQQLAASQTPNTHYITQDAFIRKTVLAMGISDDEYSAAHRRFTREVNERHSIQHVTPQWLLWRKEYSIWQQFLPRIPFPGKEPVMVHPPPVNNYTSRWRSIEKKALSDNVPLSTVEAYYKERVKFAEKYFNQNLESWRIWFAESTTWSHFWTEQFHGIEPLKNGHIASHTTKSQSVTFATQIPPSIAVRSSDAVSNDNTSQSFISTVYQIQEQVMVKKADARRIRHEFFKYLQYARDWARTTHSDCTKDVRNYLADKKTWQKFFDDEEFPGICPFGGHSAECINKSLRLARTTPRSDAVQLNSNQSARQTKLFSENQKTHSDHSTFPLMAGKGFSTHSPRSSTTTSNDSQQVQSTTAFINVKYENGGAPMTLGRATKSAITTLTVDRSLATQVSDTFRSDDGRKLHDLEERLKCRLEGAHTVGSLTFTVKPFQSNDVVAFELAFRFVVSWVETCIKGDIKRMSSFVESFSLNPNVRDTSIITAQALASPISLLVNGKYIPLDSTEYERIQRMFSEHRDLRKMLELQKGCRFVLVDFNGEVNLKHLLAVTTGVIGRPEARLLDPSVVLWHPEEGNPMNLFLERWSIRVAGCLDDGDAPSIPAFWDEYRHCLSTDSSRSSSGSHELGSRGSGGGNAGAGAPAGTGEDKYLDDMIMEEAAKAVGSSKHAGAYPDSALGRYMCAPRESVPELNYTMPRPLVDRSRTGGAAGGGEKRKLEDDNDSDDGNEEEGEVFEERAEKRAKF